MAEYIEREAVLKAFEDDADGRYCPPDLVNPYEWAKSFVKEIPAADVREVVTCGKCKHSAHDWQGNRYCGLVKTYNTVDDDWFCADGERLTNCGANMREVEHG